jgi:hypothetical protein
VAFEVEYTDKFEAWWDGLNVDEQRSVRASVELLEIEGPRWAVPTPILSRVRYSPT